MSRILRIVLMIILMAMVIVNIFEHNIEHALLWLILANQEIIMNRIDRGY